MAVIYVHAFKNLNSIAYEVVFGDDIRWINGHYSIRSVKTNDLSSSGMEVFPCVC